MRTHCGVRKQSGHLESATLFADHCGSECCCQLYISSENKKKRGGEISEPLGAPCKTRNQCSVYSPLKLAHIEEEGFGHVNANLCHFHVFFLVAREYFCLFGTNFLPAKEMAEELTRGGGGYVCLPLPPFTRAAAKYMHILLLRSVAMLPTRVKKHKILTMSKERL